MNSTRIVLRDYQQKIIDILKSHENENVLIELDCGLGKRIITYYLVNMIYPDKRIIIVVHSTASLNETVHYMLNEYGGVSGLEVISSRTASNKRRMLLKNARVIVTTPQILESILRDYDKLTGFDIVIINEVDTLIRRSSRNVVLKNPWYSLLPKLEDVWIIGMSGTLRDDHYVVDEMQIKIVSELKTLKRFIKDSYVITMSELMKTDIRKYVKPTRIFIQLVDDPGTVELLKAIDTRVNLIRKQIGIELRSEGFEDSLNQVHFIIEQLPVDEDLKSEYMKLLMLRKYINALSYKDYKKYLHATFGKNPFDLLNISTIPPRLSPKLFYILSIVNSHKKSVVIGSYLRALYDLRDILEKRKIPSYIITGKIREKSEIITQFKNAKGTAVLLMSPVGERDLDIPDADVLIMIDVINTVKTMYQKLKRTRGGTVILVGYKDTSEEKKIKRLVSNIIDRYPWSTIEETGEVPGTVSWD